MRGSSRRVVQRMYSVLRGPLRLSCVPREKTRGTELSHANTLLSCWRARNAGAAGVVPIGWETDVPWDTSVGKGVDSLGDRMTRGEIRVGMIQAQIGQ